MSGQDPEFQIPGLMWYKHNGLKSPRSEIKFAPKNSTYLKLTHNIQNERSEVQ